MKRIVCLILALAPLNASAFFGTEGEVQAVIQDFDGKTVTVRTVDRKLHKIPRDQLKEFEIREGKMVWIEARIDKILRKHAF